MEGDRFHVSGAYSDRVDGEEDGIRNWTLDMGDR